MSDKNKILKFLIQVIGWGLVFGFPLFFTWKEGNPMTWVKFLGYVGVPIFYYCILCQLFYFYRSLVVPEKVIGIYYCQFIPFCVAELMFTWMAGVLFYSFCQ